MRIPFDVKVNYVNYGPMVSRGGERKSRRNFRIINPWRWVGGGHVKGFHSKPKTNGLWNWTKIIQNACVAYAKFMQKDIRFEWIKRSGARGPHRVTHFAWHQWMGKYIHHGAWPFGYAFFSLTWLEKSCVSSWERFFRNVKLMK